MGFTNQERMEMQREAQKEDEYFSKMFRICPDCNGRGWNPNTADECLTCDGMGSVKND